MNVQMDEMINNIHDSLTAVKNLLALVESMID